MTATTSAPAAAIQPVRQPCRPALRARLESWAHHRWLQLALVLTIGVLLGWDRLLLCRQYLFRYTDEDQCCMWYAAHDLLHGRIGEPSFYGQDYNCCLEGFLAAPLVALGVPYNVACPLVTVLLGLLPFVLLGIVAWRRGHAVMAGACLLVPLLMPIRYGMICGIPRGFVNGLAVASLSMVLLLPPAPRRSLAGPRKPPSLRRSWPGLRYFLAAGLALAAVQVNPGCALLLMPVAVYAILTSWREWRFWVCGLAGLLAAAPYPIYVHQFYYVYHPDYVLHFRGFESRWTYAQFVTFMQQFVAPPVGRSLILTDLVPIPITGEQAARFMVTAFSIVGVLLLVRRRSAALCAGLAGTLFLFFCFADNRVRVGGTNASYAYSRMWLALPIVFVWLLFLVNHRPWPRLDGTALNRWLTRGLLAGLLLAGIYAFHAKRQQLPTVVDEEVRAGGTCPAVPVELIYATAREVQRIAQAQHADLVILGGGDREKDFTYAIPAITGIETLYPPFERRTWRWVEERAARHQAILFIAMPVPGATMAGGGNSVWCDADGNRVPTPPVGSSTTGLHRVTVPPIMMMPAGGRSAYDVAPIRSRARLLNVFTPAATPADPHPGLRVAR